MTAATAETRSDPLERRRLDLERWRTRRGTCWSSAAASPVSVRQWMLRVAAFAWPSSSAPTSPPARPTARHGSSTAACTVSSISASVSSAKRCLGQEQKDRGASIAPRFAAVLGAELGWDDDRRVEEIARFVAGAHRDFDVPDASAASVAW